MIRKLCFILLSFLFLTGIVISAQAETLRFQCAYPEKAHAGKSAMYFASEVEKLTNNSVKVEIHWPGTDKLVENKDAYDAMTQGKMEGYIGSFLYMLKYIPEGNCQWLPFNWENANEARDILLNKGYMNILEQATVQKGIVYLAPVSVATMGLMTTFPINKLEDLQGKKIRAVGMEAKILEALGGLPVGVGATKQYEAFQTKEIEGTDYPWYTLSPYKFNEFVKYISNPAFHNPGIIEILVGQKTYASLSDAQQKALKKAALNTMDYSFNAAVALDQKAVEGANKGNIQVLKLSMDEQARFRAAVKPLWEETANKSPLSSKLVEILMAELIAKGYTF